MKPCPRLFIACLGLTLLPVFSARAEQVVCHYTYAGETKQLVASAVASPYTVKGIQVGSFFQFRVVFQNKPADLASIKVYTYADHDDGPVLIHQATYAYPAARQRATRNGFSGLHTVFEPTLGGDLQYWCALKKTAARAAR